MFFKLHPLKDSNSKSQKKKNYLSRETELHLEKAYQPGPTSSKGTVQQNVIQRFITVQTKHTNRGAMRNGASQLDALPLKVRFSDLFRIAMLAKGSIADHRDDVCYFILGFIFLWCTKRWVYYLKKGWMLNLIDTLGHWSLQGLFQLNSFPSIWQFFLLEKHGFQSFREVKVPSYG